MTSSTWPNQGFAPRAIAILSYAILLGGAVTILLAIYLVVVGHSKLPFWDGWTEIDFAANEGPAHTFDWLWRQFNQHRVVIPKLFLLADLRWFRATQIFLLVSTLIIQFLHLSLLGWSMRVFGGWRGALWRTGIGLAAFCLFSPAQWPNLLMGFTGLCCCLPPFFASLSFVGLLLYWRDSREPSSRRGSWKYLLLCILAALCATFSLSNGNLVWPLLLLAALVLRVRLVAILTIASAAAIGISAFFYNYTVYIRASSLIHSSDELLALIKYIAVYFGSSWVQSNVRAAELLGIAGFMIFLFVLLQAPGYFRTSPAFCTQLVLTMLFVFATGVVTAPGRLVFGIEQAFSGRYQSFALLFWACMALFMLGALSSFGALFLEEVVLLSVMLFAASKAGTPLAKARWQGFNIDAAAVALVSGVPDNGQLVWVDSHPDYARSFVPYMRSERVSVFSDPEASYIGQPLNSLFGLTSGNTCVGKVESTTVITGTWPRSLRITGWAWDSEDRRPPSEILVTTDGVIAGLGAIGDWRPKQETSNARITSHFTGFTAYVRDVPRSSRVDIYAVSLQGGKLVCHIATLNPE